MDWRQLENEFEKRSKAGDWDAKWCFDPSGRSRQRWELAGAQNFEQSSAFGQMLVVSGRLLRQAAEGPKRIVPERLFSGEPRMAEAWLNALRHFGINVERDDAWGLRRDEGRIVNVAHASTQLCIRLRVHRTESVRSAHDDVAVNLQRHPKTILDLREEPNAI